MKSEESIYKMLKRQHIEVDSAEIINGYAYRYKLCARQINRRVAKMHAEYVFYDVDEETRRRFTKVQEREYKQILELWHAIQHILRDQEKKGDLIQAP